MTDSRHRKAFLRVVWFWWREKEQIDRGRRFSNQGSPQPKSCLFIVYLMLFYFLASFPDFGKASVLSCAVHYDII